MTKFDWSKIKPIPGFDSLKWKAEIHAQIQRETAGMTDEEIRERLRKSSEEIAIRRAEYVARQAAENQS